MGWCSSFVCAVVGGLLLGLQNTSAATAKKVADAAVHRFAAGAAVGSGKGAAGEGRGWVGVQVVLPVAEEGYASAIAE